eukprot:9536503-Alexandrium_andersonii.AAC.1
MLFEWCCSCVRSGADGSGAGCGVGFARFREGAAGRARARNRLSPILSCVAHGVAKVEPSSQWRPPVAAAAVHLRSR